MTEVIKQLYELRRGTRLRIPGQDEVFVLKTIDGMYSVCVGENTGAIEHFSVLQRFKQGGDDVYVALELKL